MSVIDDIIDKHKREIMQIGVGVFYHIHDLKGLANDLRPYLNLAEYVMHNYVVDMRGEFIIEGQGEFMELINNIREQAK